MPIKKSAKKALRQSKKRRIRNLKKTKEMKDAIKKIVKLANEKKTDEAKKILPLAYKAIDKAVKTGILKKNAGGRKKSRLMKLLKA